MSNVTDVFVFLTFFFDKLRPVVFSTFLNQLKNDSCLTGTLKKKVGIHSPQVTVRGLIQTTLCAPSKTPKISHVTKELTHEPTLV